MRVAKTRLAAALPLLTFAMMILPISAMAKLPSVVVSLPPLYSLVASVMGDTGTPHLLLRGGRSPHNVALRPSDLKRLRAANLVVWVGPTLETFLAKPLNAIVKKSTIITLLDLGPLTRLSRRVGRSWDKHDHNHKAPRGLSDAVVDPHFWLSPANAVVIARAVSQALIFNDPDNAAAYQRNLGNLISRIGNLEKRLRKSLAPVQHLPYLVFHDAYQYLEQHFGLNALGAVSINPEHRSGAKRITEIRRRLTQMGVRCVFREPQFPPRIINTIVKGTKVRIGLLDPLGASIPPGPDQWFQLMSNLGNSLVGCLRNKKI